MSKPEDGKPGEGGDAEKKPKKTEPVLSATEKMMVEMQKRKIQAMRMKKEQLELFRDTFVIFDKDGDGTIDSKELSTVLKSMGYNPTHEEIKEMVEDVDSDGSGSIEFLEFLLLMGGILKDVPTDLDLRDAFTGKLFLSKAPVTILLDFVLSRKTPFISVVVFDKDRSGFASSSEIKAVMANLGVHFTDDEMQEMMLEVGQAKQ